MISYNNQRVGIFVDVQNMYYSARALYDTSVNFAKILEIAVSNRQLIRAFAYVIKSEAPKEQGFFDALERSGYEIRSKDIQVFGDGRKKGDWDVGLAIDAIKIADKVDVVVLVSGDGDYAPLITYLKENRGCRVEAIAFGRSSSGKLLEVVDKFTDIDSAVKLFTFKVKHAED